MEYDWDTQLTEQYMLDVTAYKYTCTHIISIYKHKFAYIFISVYLICIYVR